jgi:hypothetical protein
MKPAIVEMATSPCAGNDKLVAHEAGLRGGHLGVIAQTIKGFLAVARRCAGRREAIFGAYRKLTGTHASEGDNARPFERLERRHVGGTGCPTPSAVLSSERPRRRLAEANAA